MENLVGALLSIVVLTLTIILVVSDKEGEIPKKYTPLMWTIVVLILYIVYTMLSMV